MGDHVRIHDGGVGHDDLEVEAELAQAVGVHDLHDPPQERRPAGRAGNLIDHYEDVAYLRGQRPHLLLDDPAGLLVVGALEEEV